MIRRVCFDRVGGYKTQTEPCEDYDLQLRIAESYKFQVVKEFLIGYRRVSRSRSFNYKNMETSRLIIMKGIKQRYPDIPSFIYQWSWGHYCLYLSHQSSSCTHYWASILYRCKAARKSPVFLLYLEFHWYLCACIWRLVKKAVIFAARIAHYPSGRIFEKAIPTREEVTISDIKIRSSRPPSGMTKLHRIRLQFIQRLFAK